MAYNTNGLSLVSEPLAGGYPRVFTYNNTEGAADATLVGASYFSDGSLKGMRVDDLCHVVDTANHKYKLYVVTSVSGDAATLAAPTAIT